MNLKATRIVLFVQFLTATSANLNDTYYYHYDSTAPSPDEVEATVLDPELTATSVNLTDTTLRSDGNEITILDVEDRPLCGKKSPVYFKREVRFGEPITVHFCNPNKAKENVVPWIGLFKDRTHLSLRRKPSKLRLQAWLNDCNSQFSCPTTTHAGSVEFSATDPASSRYNNFPYHSGTYRVCLMGGIWNSSRNTHEVVGRCKRLTVLPPQDKMTDKAEVEPFNEGGKSKHADKKKILKGRNGILDPGYGN